MFTTKNLAMTQTGLTIAVRTANDEHTHVLTASFTLPLTHELAEELGPSVARDLFILAQRNNGPEWLPKPEMTNVRLLIETSAYIVDILPHPEAPLRKKHDRIPGVRIKGIGANKGETPNGALWNLHFAMTFEVADFNHLVRLAQGLKLTQYLSFEEEQPALKQQTSDNPSNDAGTTGPKNQRFDEFMNSDHASSETGLMRTRADEPPVVDGEVVDAGAGDAVGQDGRRALPPANDALPEMNDAPPPSNDAAADDASGTDQPTF